MVRTGNSYTELGNKMTKDTKEEMDARRRQETKEVQEDEEELEK